MVWALIVVALVLAGVLTWASVRSRRGTPGGRTLGPDQLRIRGEGNAAMGAHNYWKRQDGRPR
jgi:hypothetical protein